VATRDAEPMTGGVHSTPWSATPSVASIVAAVYELHPRLAVPWPSLATDSCATSPSSRTSCYASPVRCCMIGDSRRSPWIILLLIVSLHATLRSRGMIVCYELDYDVAPRAFDLFSFADKICRDRMADGPRPMEVKATMTGQPNRANLRGSKTENHISRLLREGFHSAECCARCASP
jgi:hypothetical protein